MFCIYKPSGYQTAKVSVYLIKTQQQQLACGRHARGPRGKQTVSKVCFLYLDQRVFEDGKTVGMTKPFGLDPHWTFSRPLHTVYSWTHRPGFHQPHGNSVCSHDASQLVLLVNISIKRAINSVLIELLRAIIALHLAWLHGQRTKRSQKKRHQMQLGGVNVCRTSTRETCLYGNNCEYTECPLGPALAPCAPGSCLSVTSCTSGHNNAHVSGSTERGSRSPKAQHSRLRENDVNTPNLLKK